MGGSLESKRAGRTKRGSHVGIKSIRTDIRLFALLDGRKPFLREGSWKILRFSPLGDMSRKWDVEFNTSQEGNLKFLMFIANGNRDALTVKSRRTLSIRESAYQLSPLFVLLTA